MKNRPNLRPVPRPSSVLALVMTTVLVASGCRTPSGPDVAAQRERVAQFAALDLPTPGPTRTADGRPGPAYWQQRADHEIEAELFPAERRVVATQRITYTNNAPLELTYIWLDLAQNLFLAHSRGAQATDPSDRFPAPHDDRFGFRLAGVTVDGVPVEPLVTDTRARLDLPRPLAAGGGRVIIEMGFEFEIPYPGANRMGLLEHPDGDIFELAQWFPHVVRYDDVFGWNTLPYLGRGEFYTDHGDYRVTITVPEDHIVVATGELENPSTVFEGDELVAYETAVTSDMPVWIRRPEAARERATRGGSGRRSWTFTASDVRTFAWASSAAFCLDGAGIGVRGREGRVLCLSAYPPREATLWGPDHMDLPDEEGGRSAGSTRMIRHAIAFYSGFFGYPYPYPTMTNVMGAEYGMEYPMIMFCQGSYFDDDGLMATDPDERRSRRLGLFGVTDHEVLHTWFPMVVNTDERRHAWMDEGLNTFGNIYSERAWRVRRGEPEAPSLVERVAALMPEYRGGPTILTEADRVGRWGVVGYLMYGKAGVGLYILREQILGPERFDAAMHAYVNDWAYRSPRPADFFRTMENAAGEDLSWFWRTWFADSGVMDFAVASISSRGDRRDPEDEDRFLPATVVIEDRGDIPMPVTYRVTYADGSTEDRTLAVEAWYGGRRATDAWDTGGRRVASVEIDPDRVMPDVDRGNNARR